MLSLLSQFVKVATFIEKGGSTKNLNADIDGFVIKDVASKMGKVIDYISDGKTNATEFGKKFDNVSKNITIKFDLKKDKVK